MTNNRKNLVLDIVRNDKTFELSKVHDCWIGKCIHCNSQITVSPEGKTLSATIEHIVPQSHGGTDDLKNLALACRSCNNTKGRKIDKLSVRHPKYLEVIEMLLKKRQDRELV
jgi:5-methylcytosine-specific restriction endonuclease McrA